MGHDAGYNSSASYANFLGYYAGRNATGTSYSNFLGANSGENSTSSAGCNFLGYYAGNTATNAIYSNMFIQNSGYSSSGASYCNFLGLNAGRQTVNAAYSNFLGSGSGYGATSAHDSNFFGQNAGRNATGAVESIMIGKNAGYNSVGSGITGAYNIIFGTDVGKSITTGSGNVLIGYKVGDALTSGSYNVALGYDIDLPSNSANGQLTIQNAIFGTGNTGVGTTASTGKIGIYTPAPTCALDVTGGIATSRTAVTAPATTDGNIFSGTYTPTLTGVTNVTSSTAYVCQYMRVGNVVTVSGKIEVTPTINNTQTTIGISLPIASNFANSNELGGTSHTVANTIAGHGAAIYADATNDRAEMDYFETHGASDTFAFSFTYKII